MGEFGWLDSTIFVSLLLTSIIIGLFSTRNQKNTAKEFITAGGKMNSVPVALSMLASFLSSITIVGQPAEVYLYGLETWLLGVSTLFIIPLVGNIMAPFFRKKNYFSAYQYFGERYSRHLQLLASTIFTLQMVIYLAAVLYAPALTLNQMVGVDTMVIVTVMYGVCIFYTTVGGMKAVVWIDAFQVFVIFISLFIIIYKGTNNIGGFSTVYERNKEFNRTTMFNFDLDVTKRYTFWSTFFGSSILHMANYSANQFLTQRYQTVRSVKDCVRMLWINAIGWILTLSLCVYSGMLIFATYCYCDPLLTHNITNPDQLFPIFIRDVLDLPGIQGLFQCAVFSAGLSTLSNGMNSLAAIWFAELEGTKFKQKLSEFKSGVIVKLLSGGLGVLSFFIVFAIPHMGSLVQISITLTNTITGTLFGIFILGMYFPNSNSKGAIAGLLASIFILSWISVGYNISVKQGLIIDEPLPSSTRDCSNNTLLPESSTKELEKAAFPYRISYNWYGAIAVFTTIIIGNLVSYIFKEQNNNESSMNSGPDSPFINQKEPKPLVIMQSKK